ncbi:prostaglandin reductase 1 [Leptinotarsa decemlineata]|uniref:prostaglandin reductase 1 n=1 Tax=Leptinotarsa decemlineata TaxID=7539 RepID=UPI000C2546DF|nr:prostaglandin reductase 1-like [Leptinotarsa decemlineata]
MVKAKVYIFEKQFDGFPKSGDLKIIEEELPPIKDGEFLAEAVYLSVDPYMRARAQFLKLGEPFIGFQIAKICESKNPEFPCGKHVLGFFGWRTHTISNGIHPEKDRKSTLIPDELNDLPLSLSLGVLGRPGNSAYFGFLEICKPKEGETVVVSGASGAVGSIVGQIAKIKGCKVIGIAGSDEKCKWITNELGFDHAINYKTEDVDAVLRKLSPEGIDCYFDNVGGEISSTVIHHLKKFGRVSICGAISGYNETSKVKSIYRPIISNELTLEGFLVARWVDRWDEGIKQNLKWIKEGKLKYRETITEGFENMFTAFTDMLSGKNFGKAVVKV